MVVCAIDDSIVNQQLYDGVQYLVRVARPPTDRSHLYNDVLVQSHHRQRLLQSCSHCVREQHCAYRFYKLGHSRVPRPPLVTD